METWRALVGFEGKYEVSSAGRIKRIGKGRGVKTGRMLRLNVMPAGYLVANLWRQNKPFGKLVHVAVAEAFIGPRPPGHEVNHIDLDKSHNGAENLEYVTRSENLIHRAAAGIGRGERNASAKLTEQAVREIRQRKAKGEGYKSLGKAYGVRWEAIRNIIKRQSWRWVA